MWICSKIYCFRWVGPDADLIKFIDTIEQGTSNLKAVGHESQMDCHLSALNLEKKLPHRILVEFSLLMAENPSDSKEPDENSS